MFIEQIERRDRWGRYIFATVTKINQVTIRHRHKRLTKEWIRAEGAAHIDGQVVVSNNYWFAQTTSHDLSDIAQDDRRVNVDNIRVNFFQDSTEWEDRQKRDTKLPVGGPCK